MKRRTLVSLIFTTGLILILIGLVIIREDDIVTFISSYVLPNNANVTLGQPNKYYRDYDFNFVKNTNDFSPNNYSDILNIYYTAIYAGKVSFTFYCPKTYKNCLIDIQKLANDQDLLSDINNFVHPYNGFSHIETEYDSLGRVTLNVIRTYTDNEINLINQKIDSLYPLLVNDANTFEDNIRNVHDYIINNSKYDSDRSDRNIINYKSDTAYGPLFEGYAICGGYTDLMELFLERMGIKSFKVSSENHIWNAVMIGNKWYNLDLTWDDPVASDGNNYLEHNYFLITTQQLLSIETTQHIFNQELYSELREA